MNDLIKDEKKIKVFCFLCILVYFASYVTRINYGAVISEIVIKRNILKSSAGLVTTFGFISYGAGQLVSGVLGDKFNPKKLIFGGLIFASIFNFIMPFINNIYIMSAVWALNGFAQAFMWPPLVKIMSIYLSDENFKKTCVNVSIGSSAATILIYLISPVCIVIYGFELVFIIGGIVGLIVAFLWIYFLNKYNVSNENNLLNETKKTQKKKIPVSVIFSSGIILIGFAIIMQGILRDGITTWLPSFISENFNLKSSAAILGTVILPVFTIISFKFVAFVNNKFIKDEVTLSLLLFLISTFFCIIMTILLKSLLISVFSSAVVVGCMNGINLMLICIVPKKFEKFNMTSTMSGALNSLTYVGSSLSSYGFAKISESFGWQVTILFWGLIALFGALFLMVCKKAWNKFKNA